MLPSSRLSHVYRLQFFALLAGMDYAIHVAGAGEAAVAVFQSTFCEQLTGYVSWHIHQVSKSDHRGSGAGVELGCASDQTALRILSRSSPPFQCMCLLPLHLQCNVTGLRPGSVLVESTLLYDAATQQPQVCFPSMRVAHHVAHARQHASPRAQVPACRQQELVEPL